jgi:ABC-2 type transport system ATP-binding protein
MTAVIDINKLTKYYGKTRGIENLSLSVEQGEFFGFLGPNGAGKSTTIATLMDFLRPTSGSIEILGLDSVKDTTAIKSQVGYLAGDLELYGKLTGHQILEYLANLRGKVDRSYMHELSEQLEAVLNRPFAHLSRGNKQKIGLIQAMMHHPQLLILDEPTSGLDPLVQQSFYHILADYKKAGGSVFMSSHILPEVDRLCDRVGIIREGKLIDVIDLPTLRKQAVRRLEIRFAGPVKAEAFRKLPGVEHVHVDGNSLHAQVVGSLDKLVKTAGKYEVVDIVSHEPDLEEVFLRFYRKGSKHV